MYMESRKMILINLSRAAMEMQIYRTEVWTERKRKTGGKTWGSGTETYILPYVK